MMIPATKSILDELLEEFSDEILNVTMVDEEANFNPTRDIKELERLLAKYPHEEMGFEVTSNRNYVVKVLLSTAITVYTEVDLEHGLEHAVSSSYRANLGE
ncbi:hypothetical protein Tco_1151638 [Tanacetum coccineum]